MNKSLVPEYSLVEKSFYTSSLVTLCCNVLSIIVNAYFLKKTFTYEPFKHRKIFKNMIMIMCIEYVIINFSHISFNCFYLYYFYSNKEVHVNTCSKFQILDTDFNQIIIMTPIFFNIVRFYNVILQKSTNIITILITFIVCFGALLYLTIPQLLEINVYYIPKTGCPFEIYSNIPYFAEVQIFNFFLLVFIPIVGFVLNYIIYKLVVYRKNKITARENQTENRNLFRSIAIQSLYPFGCQFPGICLIIYQLVTYKSNYLIDVIIIFIYHFGQAFCILLSLFVIREFRIVIYKDFRIPVLGETTQIFNAKKATTTRTIAINNI